MTQQESRTCSRCRRSLPEGDFGWDPFLDRANRYCRRCFFFEADTLSKRLAWYACESVPPDWPDDMGTDPKSIRDWLVGNADTPRGMREVLYARNMMTPVEVARSLIARGRLDELELSVVVPDDQPDRHRKLKQQLRIYERHFGTEDLHGTERRLDSPYAVD